VQEKREKGADRGREGKNRCQARRRNWLQKRESLVCRDPRESREGKRLGHGKRKENLEERRKNFR